jgi:glycosyltransferase involved in cell wall biosynthesis
MSVRGARIGLVGPLPPPSGGMANQTLQLSNLLREEGFKVDLIQVNRSYRPGWVARLKGVRAAFRLVPYIAHLWASAGRVQLFHIMANSGWSWHLFAAPAIWIAKLRGIPVVVNYRGGEADVFFNRAFSSVRPSLSRADAIIVPSGFLDAVFAKRGFPTRIVPNIIDLSRFQAEARPYALGPRESPHLIVTRNLELIYDNATALRAFSIVRHAYPAARLTLAGTGPERSALEKLAEGLGVADAVVFSGRVDNERMAALYLSADLMLNPSLADNMPISILEALASGVPVVTTNVGGVPYLVEHEKTALLVPPKNPEAMAEAVLLLLNDPVRAEEIRQAGIDSVRQYAWPNVRARLLHVYEQLLAKTSRSMADVQ